MGRMSDLAIDLMPDYQVQEEDPPARGLAPDRLDLAALWSTLPDEDRARIGTLALGVICSVRAAELAEMELDAIAMRAAGAAAFTFDRWLAAADVPDAVESAIRDDVGFHIASELGPVCRGCGCSEDDACEDGCAWADEAQTTCTACVAKSKAEALLYPDGIPF